MGSPAPEDARVMPLASLEDVLQIGRSEEDTENLVVAGFGYSSASRSFDDRVGVLRWGENFLDEELSRQKEIRSSVTEDENAICRGDSGGPIYIKREN